MTAGVQRGCVLSPRLLCAVLECAMWRHAVGQAGIDFMDGGPTLLDLWMNRGWHSDFFPLTSGTAASDRFIDDTFGAGRFAAECGKDPGANQWRTAAFNSCNGWRTEPSNLATECRSKLVGLHVDSRRVTITMPSRNGHRAIYNSHLATLDVHFRKLGKSIVGPPMRKKKWNLARHVATLPAHRWVQRLLSWHPLNARRVSHPRQWWESELQTYWELFDLAPLCHGAAALLGHREWNLTTILHLHKTDKVLRILQP